MGEKLLEQVFNLKFMAKQVRKHVCIAPSCNTACPCAMVPVVASALPPSPTLAHHHAPPPNHTHIQQLNRSAIKCEKDEKSERLKVKKAIEKGNAEGAKIYAQNAIRKKHEQLNYLKLASRLDAVVSRLDTQAKMQMVSCARRARLGGGGGGGGGVVCLAGGRRAEGGSRRRVLHSTRT
jgi:hypothetical protein